MPTVALVMSRTADDLGDEVPALDAALGARGVGMTPVAWGDETVDWSAFDGAVVRGTHDYIDDPAAFARWAEHVASATRLANPAPLLAWNVDKRYLRDLSEAGIATVPTVWAEAGGQPPAVPAAWGEVVVKPSIGVAGIGASRFPADRHADAVDRAVAIASSSEGAGMIQPFMAGVEGEGETGTYLFGGEPSHAIRKLGQLRAGARPFANRDEVVLPDVTARPLDAVLVAFAREVLAAAPVRAEDVLYARVDTVPSPTGPMLIELEVTEPWLFVDLAPEAADRFAEAVVRWLGAP